MKASYRGEREWFNNNSLGPLYGKYLSLVGQISAAFPRLILTACPQCLVTFLTCSSNRGRGDIRCPFGCRDGHKKAASHSRVKAYYSAPEGKSKKQIQNEKRKRGRSKDRPCDSPIRSSKVDLYLLYLQFLLSIISGEAPTLGEVFSLVNRIGAVWRQHGLDSCPGPGILPDD